MFSKTFTHMGIFKLNGNRVVLRRAKNLWVAPNGVSYEKRSPLLNIQRIPKRIMNGQEIIK